MPERLEIKYADGASGPLCGDLYLPNGAPASVLVAVPGGAWRAGNRKQLAGWGRYLAGQGFAVFAIDYRLATGGPGFPGNLRDVRAALAFVHESMGTLGVDAAKLGLFGASAGGHLAALAALSDRPDLPPLPKLSALVGAYGVYDLFRHWQDGRADNPALGEDITESMLGTTPFEDPQRYFDASPLFQVRYAKNALKTLLIWGEDDRDVLPETQSKAFVLALRQARFFVRTIPVPGAGHFWFSEEPLDDPRSRTAQIAPAIVRFLRHHLAGVPR